MIDAIAYGSLALGAVLIGAATSWPMMIAGWVLAVPATAYVMRVPKK